MQFTIKIHYVKNNCGKILTTLKINISHGSATTKPMLRRRCV